MLLLADAAVFPLPLAAREVAYPIDIPAGSLDAALARFSEQTGVSVGIAGAMPAIRVPHVKGRMTADAALRELLRGTGLEAQRIGTIYRIEPVPPAHPATRPAPPTPPPAPTPIPPAPDIVVTAQKRRETLDTVPFSLSVVRFDGLAGASSTPSNTDIALATEGLATTNLGPGRNRQFIRGVADSPFNGKSQSTVAVQIDDARVTFDAPNPDLRLIDVERVEILKGPQGPLYGSGALGGIYHVVTHKPDLDRSSGMVRLQAEGVEHGGVAASIETVANVPVVRDTLALRVAAYRVVEPGWIDNTDGRSNSNSAKTAGARLALRWIPAPDWTIDAGLARQDIDARDSQYVSTSAKDLARNSRIPEPTDNNFKMAHATIEGKLGALRLVSATSMVRQDFDYALDASDAATALGTTAPARFEDNRSYAVYNQELRLSPAQGGNWLVGVSLLRATSRGYSTITDAAGASQVVESFDRRSSELALFGEASHRLVGTLEATVGARLFRSVSRDLAAEAVDAREVRRRRLLASPSASLSLPLSGEGIVYFRYARAKRPGGLAPSGIGTTGQFAADKVNSFDVGLRRTAAQRRLTLAASVYHMRWDRVQSDYLLPNGLVSTRNAGDASIFGLEAELEWQAGAGITVSAGGAAQRARLVRAEDGSRLKDTRLPVAPAFTARLSMAKAMAFSGWHGQAALQANYVGRARLSFDSDLDRPMGNYALVAASAAMSKGSYAVSLRLDNALDAKSDSFAFGNPFSIRADRQFTPLRPRSIVLSITRSW